MDARTLLGWALARAQLVNLVTTLLIGLLLAWQYNIDDRIGDTLLSTGILGFFWCVLVTIMVAGKRCSELELSLPLSGRTIWKNHVAITIVTSMIHVAVFILPITITGTPFVRGQYLSAGGHMLAGLIMLGSLIHSIKPNRNRLSIPALNTWAFFVGLLITVALVSNRSPWLSTGMVALAGLILLAAGRQVQETLTLVDDRPAPRGGYASLGRWEPETGVNAESNPILLKGPATAGRHLSTLWMLGTMNLKQFSNFFQSTGFWILIFLGGALATPGADLRKMIVSILGSFVIFNVLSPELIRSGSPYAHLPIPRRRLHAGMLLPVLAAVAFGAAAQIAIGVATGTDPWLVRAVEWVEKNQEPYYTIKVPPRFHQIAWDGQPPVVVGSTGERYTPRPLINKSLNPDTNDPVIYNPYEVGYKVGRRSSKAFATEQYIRAVKAVYGVDLDRQQAEFLITEHNGSLKTMDGLTIARTPQRTAIGIFLFCAIWALLSTLFTLFVWLVRPARFERWRTKFRAPAIIPVVIVIAAFVMAIKTPGEFTPWLMNYVSVETTRLSHVMPGAILSLTGAMICLAGVWLLSQELFARRQMLPGRS